MDKSDALGIAVSLIIAGAFIYAYERGYIKIPELTQTTPTTTTSQTQTTTSTPSTSTQTTTTQTTTTQSTTTTQTTTTSSQYGTFSGTMYVGTGSSTQTYQFTVTTPSSSTSTSTSSSSGYSSPTTSSSSGSTTTSSTSTSTSTSSGSTTTSTSSGSTTTSTSTSSGSTSTSSSGSTSGYGYQAVQNASWNCSTPTSCPSFLTGGQCYNVACDCFSTYPAVINNNWGQSVPIEIFTAFLSYCDMTTGVTWDGGNIAPGQWTMNLPYAPGNTSVGGGIYVWAPGKQTPYLLNYATINGNNLLLLREIDLAPTTTVTVTNNSPYTIILQNVSNFFVNDEVQIPPGGSGSVNVGNGWMWSVGTVDITENYPSSNPAPTSCFISFILAGGQPAVQFVNDQNYQECSQWQFTLSVNGQTYQGNLGEGLTNNVYTVGSSSSSSSSGSTSSTSSSSSTATASSPYNTGTTVYGGVRPKIVPY